MDLDKSHSREQKSKHDGVSIYIKHGDEVFFNTGVSLLQFCLTKRFAFVFNFIDQSMMAETTYVRITID